MTRQEKRRRLREAIKELSSLEKSKVYKQFKNTNEFMLPKEELDQLITGTHENKKLQARFSLAKAIYIKRDYLMQAIAELSPVKEDVSLTE